MGITVPEGDYIDTKGRVLKQAQKGITDIPSVSARGLAWGSANRDMYSARMRGIIP